MGEETSDNGATGPDVTAGEAKEPGGRAASRRDFLKAAGIAVGGTAIAGGVGMAAGAAVYASNIDQLQLFGPDKKTPHPGMEHLVVVMYENRSFDNIFGWLYGKDEVPVGASFDGLAQGHYSNPIPGTGERIEAHVYTGTTDHIMSSPQPDPGEAFQHVNTQLFNTVDPASNEDLHKNGLKAPYNRPPRGAKPTMQGFVHDYKINFEHLIKNDRKATRDELAVAMGGFAPEMLPTFSTLAKEFAVFDAWHCAVPSQTFCNRSFFHASTSHGFVTNQGGKGYKKWFDEESDALSIFNRLEDAGITWRVYYDESQLISLTGMLHAPATKDFWKTNFRVMDQFYYDAEHGKLPQYSFIEPRMIFDHNDMHPPYGEYKASDDGYGWTVQNAAVSDVRAGDAFLHYVYEAIKASGSPKGSNAMNTTLLITFDEHGGTYDHVPPPAATPPGDGKDGEMGFEFDRLGARVPALVVSAYTKRNTIVNDLMHHGSVAAALCRQHGVEPLTFRDKGAPDFVKALNLTAPRPVSDWPTTTQHYVPPNPDKKMDPNAPAHRNKQLSSPARGLLGLLTAQYGPAGATVPDTYQEAFTALNDYGKGLFGRLDPGLTVDDLN
jgi:phospholipase C